MGAPVSVETIIVPDPGPGEAVVQVQACGVCHPDLHYREGGINDEFPFLLGHEAAGVVESVGEGVTEVEPGDCVILNWRAVDRVVCTHAHDDHVNQAPVLAHRFKAPVLLDPAEAPLWEMTHPDRRPDRELAEGDTLTAGGVVLRVLLTPGHSPGSSCLYAPELGTVFTGDTLFQDGPGATARSFSSRP